MDQVFMMKIKAKELDEKLCRELWELSSIRGDLCDSFIVTLPYIDNYLKDVETDMKHANGWVPPPGGAYYSLLEWKKILVENNCDSIFFENR